VKSPTVLDVTLRDGSYAVNFSLTSSDTSVICRELENSGLNYIEIGHGVGFGGSRAGYGQAAQTDEEYLAAASSATKRAKFGMFCIPGIARLEDIDMAYEYKIGFIRVGTNVTEVASSKDFIEKAKYHGIFVAANYMKSYAMQPQDFAEQVKLSEKFGADMVYLVDSAGSMFPDDIEKYFNAIRNVSDIKLGFHGHDNLGMAIANSLTAVRLGFDFIDSSLQGFGRGGGNACTEILIASLLKLGYPLSVDLLRLMDAGQNYVQPLLPAKGKMPLDVISGYAGFHSSYMKHIAEASVKYQIDPRILIVEICKVNQVDLDLKVLDSIAKGIKVQGEVSLSRYAFNRYVGGEQEKK